MLNFFSLFFTFLKQMTVGGEKTPPPPPLEEEEGEQKHEDDHKLPEEREPLTARIAMFGACLGKIISPSRDQERN